MPIPATATSTCDSYYEKALADAAASNIPNKSNAADTTFKNGKKFLDQCKNHDFIKTVEIKGLTARAAFFKTKPSNKEVSLAVELATEAIFLGDNDLLNAELYLLLAQLAPSRAEATALILKSYKQIDICIGSLSQQKIDVMTEMKENGHHEQDIYDSTSKQSYGQKLQALNLEIKSINDDHQQKIKAAWKQIDKKFPQ